MLEEQDFIKIGEEVGKVIEQNITPYLGSLDKQIGSLDKQIKSLDKRLSFVESNMATKDDITIGMADLKGNIILKLRKEDEKINILVKHHIEKNLLKEEDIQALRQIEVFPQL